MILQVKKQLVAGIKARTTKSAITTSNVNAGDTIEIRNGKEKIGTAIIQKVEPLEIAGLCNFRKNGQWIVLTSQQIQLAKQLGYSDLGQLAISVKTPWTGKIVYWTNLQF